MNDIEELGPFNKRNVKYIATTLLVRAGIEFFKRGATSLWGELEKRLVFRARLYESSEMFTALEYYLYKHHEGKYRNVEIKMQDEVDERGDLRDDARSDEKDGNVPMTSTVVYQHFEDSFWIKHKGKLIHIKKQRENFEKGKDLKAAIIIHFKISSFQGKAEIKDFLQGVKEEYDLYLKDRITTDIYTNTYAHWSKVKTYKKDLNSVILRKGLRNEIEKDIETFATERSKYRKLDIPYKRTYLLHGAPGNGKTSLAAGLAGQLKRNICSMNLKSISGDNELQQLYTCIPKNSVLILEDVDACFKGRDPIGKISFATLLNCMDGVFFKEDLVTVITTNHPETLDPALLRDGRVDKKIELENPDKEQTERYLSLFYDREVILKTSYKPVFSMAQIVGFCLENKNSLEGCLKAMKPDKKETRKTSYAKNNENKK